MNYLEFGNMCVVGVKSSRGVDLLLLKKVLT